jgi:protein-disulfide isomerase
MWTREYVVTVLLITIATLTIGFLVWDSGTQRLSCTCEGWCRGADDAPITIDAYPDFLCPVCVDKELMLVQSMDMYPKEIRLVYHHYPSSGFSQKIAEALEVAGEQDKFWEMHDSIIEDVPDDMSELIAVAEGLGLDMERFNEALDSGEFSEIVHIAKEKAISAGVKYVSVFINGKEYKESPGTPADLRIAIDDELERIEANGGN